MKKEYVLCVPSYTLADFGIGQGFTPFGVGEGPLSDPSVLLNRADVFLPRDEAETDDRYKQIIAYCIIEKEPSALGNPELFMYRRQGDEEKRLQGKISIGVGGHINTEDCDDAPGFHGLSVAFRRELDEEVITTPIVGENLQWLGVVNDDSNEVGRYHVGVVARIKSQTPIRPAHEDWSHHGIYAAYVFRYGDIYNQCESWTQIVLKALYGIVPLPVPGLHTSLIK